jgi:hypothetical protein
MSENLYFTIGICLLVIRIIILAYCVERAKELNRDQLGWGVLGFILPLIAAIWIKVLKPLPPKMPFTGKAEGFVLNTGKDIIDSEDLQKILSQKESLYNLREKSFLSEDEYQDKLKLLKHKETRIRQKQLEENENHKEELLDIYVQKQIEPLLINLKELSDAGLITQDEFDFKESQIFDSMKESVVNMPCKRVKIYQLMDWQKRAVRDLYKKSNGANFIFLQRSLEN